MQKIILLILALTYCTLSTAQELEFQVSVNTPKLQTTDPKVFETLESNLQEFLNTQKWTEDVYETDERIQCSIQLTISTENGGNNYTADLAIQAIRPVFGGSYTTPMITHVDRGISFNYEQFQQLDYSENTYRDNLTSVMAFYVYIILGLDYDSFSSLGGEKYFRTAQNILNTVPPGAATRHKGWRSVDGQRNRYWLIENFLSPRMRDYRQAQYDYHRQGLDRMHKFTDSGRAKIMSSLEEIAKANRTYPNSMIIQIFSNTKRNEIVEIFKEGTAAEKARTYQIMVKLDGSSASKYAVLK